MRPIVVSAFLFMALLLPRVGSAQLSIQETAAPGVTAASADWQINGEPIFYDGNYYDPAGPTIFFDGAVMARTGAWKDVPLYQDRTLEPYTVVFVPIGGNVMKPYERRREGEPGKVDNPGSPGNVTEERPSGPSGAGGTPRSIGPPLVSVAPTVPIKPGRRLQVAPASTGTSGVFINYQGAKWFLEGEAVAFSANRFTPIGNYRGAPVYREKNGADRIWVSVVPNGPIAPYSKR